MFTGYNHTVPIGGAPHDVQTEFIDGDPPKIVSHAFVSGQVIASQSVAVEPPDLADDLKVRGLIKRQQMEMIRKLVVDERKRRKGAPTPSESPASDPSPEATAETESAVPGSGTGGGGGRPRPASPEDLDVRRALIRFSRSALQSPRREAPLDELARLVDQSAPVFAGGFDGGRSREAAEVLLARADGLECIQAQDSKRAVELVTELMRLARRFVAINRRAELQDHDRDLWRRELESLDALSEEEHPPADTMRRLRSTWGRDEGLDAMLDDPAGPGAGPLRQTLRRALQQLEAEIARR